MAIARLCAFEGASAQVPLALQLKDEGDHAGAALEFRRSAMATQGADAVGYFWAAAVEYARAGDFARAEKSLDLSEQSGPEIKWPILLLRGEAAYGLRRWNESAFYYENSAEGANGSEATRYAIRKAAAAIIRSGRPNDALALLSKSPVDEQAARDAIQRYLQEKDRSPALGGALGIVPGLGYFYSGEWANGFRSLFLNSLFIFGMVHTADNEQWGAFAVITFFEFTWYSGSIYGGIDAAHRYNQRRIEACVNGVLGGAVYEPDYTALPAISLKFNF